VIRFEQVSVTYAGAERPVLHEVTLEVPEGELCLVVGRTGSGKSTLLRAVNGLVPHFTGGTLSGRVTVDGRDTRTHPPRELADVVGHVGQDPAAGFVTDVVEDELAYAMESIGLAPAVMRRRVEETLDLLGLADLRDRPLRTLSGGQRQRVAIGSVLTAHPRVLVLDEPTSALDPAAAEEVLAALQRLVHDLGITVLLAEHRLERVVQYADRVVRLRGDGYPPHVGTAAEVMSTSPVAPPVVQLARVAGWEPPPLTVRDARRLAAPLRERLTAVPTADAVRAEPLPGVALRAAVAEVDRLTVRYGDLVALRGVSLAVRPGEVVALMGRNGAGKSTLLAAYVGSVRPLAGRVTVVGADPGDLDGPRLLRHVGLVPQDPGDLLYAESVADECRAADDDAMAPHGTTAQLYARLAPEVAPDTHPRDLSEGQRLALALAVVLVAEPPLVLLDEPTRGLDYEAKARLVVVLRDLAGRGHAVVLATHDVELAAEVATRTVVLADGEIVSDGPTWEVVVGSPAFAPQVAKVLAPDHWLTVAQVADALDALAEATG
jgi:energy-coupling factor transport system ATP-binding protein